MSCLRWTCLFSLLAFSFISLGSHLTHYTQALSRAFAFNEFLYLFFSFPLSFRFSCLDFFFFLASLPHFFIRRSERDSFLCAQVQCIGVSVCACVCLIFGHVCMLLFISRVCH